MLSFRNAPRREHEIGIPTPKIKILAQFQAQFRNGIPQIPIKNHNPSPNTETSAMCYNKHEINYHIISGSNNTYKHIDDDKSVRE